MYEPYCNAVVWVKAMRRAAPIAHAVITHAAVLGRVIKHHREQSSIGQEELARALGITQSAYSRLESGQSSLSVSQLRAIARKIRVPASTLLHEADTYANRLRAQAVEITEDKQESGAGLLIALGLLTALLAAANKS